MDFSKTVLHSTTLFFLNNYDFHELRNTSTVEHILNINIFKKKSLNEYKNELILLLSKFLTMAFYLKGKINMHLNLS